MSTVGNDTDARHRRSIRLKGYDYSQAGAYFVTLCAWRREPVFGQITQGAMRLNERGRIVQAVWDGLPDHYLGMEGDAFIVMPNHVHAIILLTGVGAGFKPAPTAAGEQAAFTAAPTAAGEQAGLTAAPAVAGELAGFTAAPAAAGEQAGFKPAPKLSEIVRALKTFSARQINDLRGTPGVPVWQRNYYEHVIRTARALDRIRSYIEANPANWTSDCENPERTGSDEMEGWLYPSRGT